MHLRPADSQHEASINALIVQLPWELQDVTRALIRALRTDAHPYAATRAAAERYAGRAGRIGQSLHRTVAAVDELTAAFAVPHVPSDYTSGFDAPDLRQRVCAWVETAHRRAD